MQFLIYFVFFYLQKCSSLNMLPPDKINVSLQIDTLNGLIQGTEKKSVNGRTYFRFVGIPYAKPPLYDLRFRAPEPINKWTGVLDATRTKPCCVGLDLFTLYKLQFNPKGEEDCLYLNVYTPQQKYEEGKTKHFLAVMVFLYGGGFLGGCANNYGPGFLMENDVVLVVPSFRGSIFGYLSTEDLECPGNWASKDQIAVLKWVQANIKKFGGDPKRVTIFGQSAGAANVNILLLSPKAKGLFHRAIQMSGSGISFWAHQRNPRKIAFDIGLSFGIETNNSTILMQELRKINSRTLIRGHIPTLVWNLGTVVTQGLPITPSVELPHNEAILTDYPYEMLEKGHFNRVPLMIGVTSFEAGSFTPGIRLVKPFLMLFNISPGSYFRMTKDFNNRTMAAKKLFAYFLRTPDVSNAGNEDILKTMAEESFLRPAIKTASLVAQHSSVYFYQFAYQGDAGLELLRRTVGVKIRNFNGASHTEDVAYLFTGEGWEWTYNTDDLKIIQKMSRVYTNFAKTGNPTPIRDALLDNITWPKATPEKTPYVILDKKFTEVSESFDEKNFKFWEELYKTYSERPYIIY